MGKREPERFTVTKYALLPGACLALLVRWCVAAYGYSGRASPPLFGDYEAQRHWQELTLHLPARQWYRNSTHNDLQYWGLDYPPLSAYHSLLLGLLADWLEPESVRLFASRGYEGEAHKLFMRASVFLCDLYFYVSAVLFLCLDAERATPRERFSAFRRTDLATALSLLYPGLILIDHGHFQYNCVSLGLFLWATFFVVAVENDMLATFIFVLALNYKQMELYHALPFFLYLLRKCMCSPRKGRLSHFVRRLAQLAITVLCAFLVTWYPLLHTWDDVLQVLRRLFPVKRGVFEDKVSNVWCFANVFVKLKYVYTNEEMVRMCVLCTLVACLPACADMFFRINKKKFVLCLINVSLAFFLFSYQVHEKSILLVAAPVTLHMAEDPFMCFWFLLVSVFSMLPLLLRDGLLVPLVCSTAIYGAFYSLVVGLAERGPRVLGVLSAGAVCAAARVPGGRRAARKLQSTAFFLSLQGMFWLALGALLVAPPPRYPDLFPLLVSAFSCAHFVLFLAYFTRQQLLLPTALPAQPKQKKN